MTKKRYVDFKAKKSERVEERLKSIQGKEQPPLDPKTAEITERKIRGFFRSIKTDRVLHKK